jgi:hypothetical protein
MISGFIKRYALTLIGILVGAIAGFLYWHFVGCASGSCPITSSPILSVIWGALLGGLLFNIFEHNKTKKQ